MSALARPQTRGMNDARGRDPEGPSTSDASLRFKAFTCGRIGYARVSGPLDLDAIAPFRQQVQRLLDAGCRALILDLSGVQFVDSQGARALLQLRDAVDKRGVW